jgi:hypothetical protein
MACCPAIVWLDKRSCLLPSYGLDVVDNEVVVVLLVANGLEVMEAVGVAADADEVGPLIEEILFCLLPVFIHPKTLANAAA